MPVCINEPVAVAASFHHGRIQPTHFLWRNQKLSIDTISFMWRTTEGETRLVHFSVLSGRTLYELVFDTKSFVWRIAAVAPNE